MEIKFRVRDKDTKEIIGYEKVSSKGQWEFMRVGRKDWILGGIMNNQFDDIGLIREQYTGLKDRNGKDIYNGDLLKGELPSAYFADILTYEVLFLEGCYFLKNLSDLTNTYPFLRGNNIYLDFVGTALSKNKAAK